MPRQFPRLSLVELPPAPPGKTGWPWTEPGPQPHDVSATDDELPSLTVVTPSYQQAEFIEATIRSVLQQGYPKLSYVIMDGGSTDGSQAIIKKYALWLAHYASGPDGGQARAIDAGFQQAPGEILAWLNSDDVFEPNALWRAARQFQQDPEAVLVYGDAEQISRDGTRLGRAQQVLACDRDYLLADNNAIVQPAAFFRRAAYVAAGGLDPSLYWAMDYDLWLKLAGLGPLVYFPETLARTRMYAEAKSSSSSSAMFDEIKSVAQRHGGQGLPRQIAGWLGGLKMPEALEALRRGDLAAGQAGLAYVIANDPGWRSEARLAETLAGEAWRRRSEAGKDSQSALRWARQICHDLPKSFVSPKRIERRVLGLLYESLAFQSYRQGRTSEGLRYAVQALAQDRRRAANRGLWSVTIRSLVKV